MERNTIIKAVGVVAGLGLLIGIITKIHYKPSKTLDPAPDLS